MPEPTVQRPKNARAAPDLTGTTVGRFAIRARLGAGGMGEVYRADDTKLKRPVAIKRMSVELKADEHYRQRFLKEAERASSLSDHHIAGVYDVLEENGEIFLVMEFVEGSTLRQRLREPLSVTEFLPVAIQCAEALVAAREKSIVHRDLKPENIMLTPRGHVKILDFGVAKRLPVPDASSETGSLGSVSGTLSGTPAYMAPEVLLEKESDERADIFSLGVVFYEVLAGRHPFLAGSFMATSDRILHETPPPLTQVNPRVPEELERIVAQMLAKDPAERYSNAAELLADLRALTSSRFPLPRPRRLRRREWWGLAAALAVLLALLAATLPSVRQPLLRWAGRSLIPEQKNLAVMPFQAIGGGAKEQAYCDGMTETLTAKLSQLTTARALQVAPASEVRARRVADAEGARRELGANLVLEGSLHRSGDMVRINYALVDARTRRQLRADTITAKASDPFAVQDRVVEGVTRMLELELMPTERQTLAAYGTEVAGAYDFYLQGRGYLQNYDRPENIENAVSVFRKALELDPNYALAHAGLGEAYWKKYEGTKETSWVETARRACEQAVAFDAKLAAGHACLGTVFNGTGLHEKAAGEFQRALESEPTSDDAYRGLATAYERMNKLTEAEKTHRRSIQLHPGYWGGYRELARFYHRRGRYGEAEQQLLKATELAPDNADIYYSLGGVYHLMGKEEEAVRALKKSLAIRPTADAYTNLGTIFHFQGRYREAVPMMEKAAELGTSDFQVWGNLGEAYRRTPEVVGKSPGAYRQAVRLADEQLAINPKDAETRAWLAVYQLKLGYQEAALAEIDRARRLAPKNVNILFRAAQIYELAGLRDRALAALRSAADSGYSMSEIRTAADLEELRKDPRYQRLVARRAAD